MEKILHRGLSSRFPENTMLAFKKAYEFGADMIEFDVHLSKDGELVVIHDDEIDRTSDGFGMIKDLSIDQLRQYNYNNGDKDAGYIRISTLKEVLLFSIDKMAVNIEVKNLPVKYNNIELELVNLLKEFKDYNKSIVVSSFDHDCLAVIKELDEDINIGILVDESWKNIDAKIQELRPYSVHPNIKFLNDEILLNCKEQGIKVYPWVAETLNDIQLLESKEYVHGIMVNEIDLFNK